LFIIKAIINISTLGGKKGLERDMVACLSQNSCLIILLNDLLAMSTEARFLLWFLYKE